VQAGSIYKVITFATILLLFSCAKGPPPAQPVGEAFVGPASLKIRSEIPLNSAIVTTVKHGDKLQILQSRRRFLRVRTPSGAEGWTDERQLLAAADMAALKELAARAAKLPSQGVATTYGILNIHTQPLVASPSFLQLKENEKFDLLQSVVLPRTDAPRKPLIPPAPKKTKAARKKEKEASKIPPPPLPKPPSPPVDWLELSKTERDEAEAEVSQAPPPALAPRVDGWSLIRTPGGQSGWVLTRLISMAIPDDVAQYAEGRRIVSYFPLGSVQDDDVKKNIWLWTTTANSKEPWDFDSFRVFTWSLRRHRYETGYIERNVKGYSPVLLKDVEVTTKGTATSNPGFSICMEKKDGQRVRREYALLGQSVRFAGERACESAPPPLTARAPAPIPVTEAAPAEAKPGLKERVKRFWASLRGK
jgi:hypothetical protein